MTPLGNPLLFVATLIAVFAFRNWRAKKRLAGSVPGGPTTLRCSVRRTYGRSRPSMWVEGKIELKSGESPVWVAAPDQATTRIVLDPSVYRRLVVDRSAETVLTDVVTLVTEGVRIEVALTAAEAGVLAPYFTEAA
jgi:hypothetical protein